MNSRQVLDKFTVGSCPTGRLRYADGETAARAAAFFIVHSKKIGRVYRGNQRETKCSFCRGWHLINPVGRSNRADVLMDDGIRVQKKFVPVIIRERPITCPGCRNLGAFVANIQTASHRPEYECNKCHRHFFIHEESTL